MPRTIHPELHRSERIGWLRAAVLGANDGIVSTASLMVGVAAAGSSRGQLLVTGMAGLVAGAMSMASGEYVSVRSQADTEDADLRRELARARRAAIAIVSAIWLLGLSLAVLLVAFGLQIFPHPLPALILGLCLLAGAVVAAIIGYASRPKEPLKEAAERLKTDVQALKEQLA